VLGYHGPAAAAALAAALALAVALALATPFFACKEWD